MATLYEDVTVDVQPDPDRYLIRIGSSHLLMVPRPTQQPHGNQSSDCIINRSPDRGGTNPQKKTTSDRVRRRRPVNWSREQPQNGTVKLFDKAGFQFCNNLSAP